MDVVSQFSRVIATVFWGSLGAWLASLGITFPESSQAIIMAGLVALIGGFVNAAIAVLQKNFPDVPWVRWLDWLMLSPLRPVFVSADDRASVRIALRNKKEVGADIYGSDKGEKLLRKFAG